MPKLKIHGRFVVATLALAIAFVLSVKFSDRGFEFDLRNTVVSATQKRGKNYKHSRLEILKKVNLQIGDNYVEPERIKPGKMLVHGLDEIQNSIAEVVVDFDRPKDQNPQTVTVTVNEAKQRFEIGKVESRWEMELVMSEIFDFVQQNTQDNPDIDFKEIEYAAINGMLATLDPHSNLLPPKHYEEMQTQTGGKFGGLGIVISIRDGSLTVISPIDGTPAARKGIKTRDQIVRIGDESTVNMNLNEAVNLLRGEPGTPVDLWVLRKGWNEPRKFSVDRAIIKIDSVDSQALGAKVGYLRIKNFQANTFSDVKKHLGTLKQKMGGMQGLVLDLRDNPGGLLDQAIKVSDLFLTDGTIVSTVGVGNRLREKREAKSSGTEEKYPIIVLVNAGSASASEIVSGALQNHDRAVILGDTTFGKGSVQVLYEFPDNSALKLTVAQYLTPGGISIQSRGISPDLRILPVGIDEQEVNLFLSNKIVREQDLDSHLTNQAISKADDGVDYIRYFKKPPGPEDEFADPEKFDEDFEIRLSQRLLSKRPPFKTDEMLAALQPELKKVAESEMGVIRKELRKLSIDWKRGKTVEPKVAKVDLTTSTNHENDTVKAGERVKVTVDVKNNGEDPLFQLKAISSSDSSVFDDREFIFGHLAPGESKQWTVEVEIPKDAPTRFDMLNLKVSDAKNTLLETDGKAIHIVGSDRPQFAFSYDVLDSSGDGVLSVGETATFRVFVENNGTADSAETLVYLKNLAKEAIYLKKGRQKLSSIPKGESAVIDFTFDVKHAPEKNDEGALGIELEVDIYDTVFREYTEKKFSIPFSKTDKKLTPTSGVAKVTTGPVTIYTAATSGSNIAAVAQSGAQLPVVGKTAGWLQVDLNPRKGWVKDTHATFVDEVAELSGLEKDVMFQPPTVSIKPSTFLTESATVQLKGKATDDFQVKDYYIFVHNRRQAKTNTKKLMYKRANKEQVTINAKIPLFKGMNRIAVIARDTEGMSTTETTYVYRK